MPELFGKPAAYARFLGQELSPVYVGPLLIVMRAGYGIYDGGRATAAEERVLAPLAISESSANDLTVAATQAVAKLTTAGALRSKDIRRPQVYPRPASGTRGSSVRMVYAVLDDSERTKETVRVLAGARQLVSIKTKQRQALYVRAHNVTWRVPRSLPKRALKFCVVAVDPAGNKSPSVCAPLTVR